MIDVSAMAARPVRSARHPQAKLSRSESELNARRIHEEAWATAVGSAPCNQRPFIFDFRIINGSRLFLHVRPCGEQAPFSADQTIRIVVRLAAVRRRGNEELSIPAEDLGRWMADLFGRHGFRLDAIVDLSLERIPFGRAGNPRRYIPTVIARAQVTVADFASASKAWGHGIGRDRAWGCGTLLLDTL